MISGGDILLGSPLHMSSSRTSLPMLSSIMALSVSIGSFEGNEHQFCLSWPQSSKSLIVVAFLNFDVFANFSLFRNSDTLTHAEDEMHINANDDVEDDDDDKVTDGNNSDGGDEREA